MGKKNITLKDIALQTGTSISTVYKVLNNKEGVGDELREKILKISNELGYVVNYAASSLSKKASNIIAILPIQDETSKYFTKQILDGYRQFKSEVSNLNFNFIEYFTTIEDFYPILEGISNDKSLKIDGMVIYPMRSGKIINLLNRIADKGVPIVIVEKDLPEVDRIACVKPNNEMAGKLAGELLCKFIHQKGKVLIADADVTIIDSDYGIVDVNSDSCERKIMEKRHDLLVEKVHIPNTDDQLYQYLKERILSDPEIIGIYSTTARNTVSVSKAVQELGMQERITVIGSEIFDENIEMLKKGVIDAIIYKNPFKIGYESLKVLINHVMRVEFAKEKYDVDPRIILESNVSIEDKF